MDNAVELHQVRQKNNRVWGLPKRVKSILFKSGFAGVKERWVLSDINLEIPKGTSLVIIGKNNSGKSTLLRIISRILRPTMGTVKVNGRVAMVLEPEAEYRIDYTGREIIYYNGLNFGFTRKEIQAKVDSIITFSELEEDIDLMVNSYSRGMYMRIVFSTALKMMPDILLVDDMISIMDQEFQKKCINEILRLKSVGTTIIFVSHTRAMAEVICDQAIWLEEGRIKFSGTTSDVIATYEQSVSTNDYLSEYYYRMGCRCKQQMRFEQALYYYDQSLENGYSEFLVKMLRISVYLELGMQEKAHEDVMRCLEIAPTSEDKDRIAILAQHVNQHRVELVRSERTRIYDNSKTEPAFLIIGTQKGGTTSLYHDLIIHPQIKSAAVKEVHFFDIQYHFGFDWYKNNFPPDLSADQITGEASPYYLFHPQTPRRVREWLPEIKLIVILRNPIQRAFSHYQMMVRRGIEPLSFPDALRAESSRIEDEYNRMIKEPRFSSENCANYSYLKRGLYAEQLERWFKYFAKNQILVMSSEAWFHNPKENYKTVLQFLNLPMYDPDVYASLNTGGYDQAIPDETLEWLRNYYAKPNQQLFDLIGQNYNW
ncbi:sulfotransferase domain-containing protein [Paenibacillus sp. strain BS8-2]